MKKSIIFISLLPLLCFYYSYGQRFSPPPKGKATVCFASTEKNAKAQIYHNNNCLETVDYLEYTIFEIDTGNNLFWIGSKDYRIDVLNNFELYFLETNLDEGRTYVIITKIENWQYGTIVNLQRHILLPISYSDTVEFRRFKRLLKHFEPKETEQKKIDKINKKNTSYIKRKLLNYQEIKEIENHDQIGKLTSDQFIPIEILNKL